MEYAEFQKRKRIPASPLYVVLGEEGFLKRRGVDRIVSHLSRGPQGALGVRSFDLEGPEEHRPTSVEQVLSDVMTPSLFTRRSIVVVWRAGKFLTKGGGAEAIGAYLETPPPEGALVLEIDSLDKRTRVGRAIRDGGFIVECKRLFDRPPPWKRDDPVYRNPLAEWIAAEGKTEGLVFPPQLAHELAERVGNDLGALHAEIVKLSLYLGADADKPKKVDAKVLSESVGDYNEFGVFRLLDAVGKGDLASSLHMAQGLLDQGLRSFGGKGKRIPPAQVPVILVGRIHAKMREIFRARAILDAGGTQEDIGAALGKHRAFLPVLMSEARSFEIEQAHRVLDILFKAEVNMKRGRAGKAAIEALLVEILSRPKRRVVSTRG